MYMIIVCVVLFYAYWYVTVCMRVIYCLILCINGGRDQVKPVGAKTERSLYF